MSVTQRPPIPSFIPETAPFTVEQRTWLNGLFAGVFGLEQGVTPLSSEDVAKLLPGFIDANAAPAAEIDDSAPWHDPAMPLADRVKLAEGRPLPRRMMAAMAQQDCGQCGYNCHDYSQALFAGREERLNLCVPGGKDTARNHRQVARQSHYADTMYARSGDGLVGNALAFHQRFLHASLAAHPQRIQVAYFSRECAVHGERGIHSAARSASANQQPHRMTSNRFLLALQSRHFAARYST